MLGRLEPVGIGQLGEYEVVGEATGDRDRQQVIEGGIGLGLLHPETIEPLVDVGHVGVGRTWSRHQRRSDRDDALDGATAIDALLVVYALAAIDCRSRLGLWLLIEDARIDRLHLVFEIHECQARYDAAHRVRDNRDAMARVVGVGAGEPPRVRRCAGRIDQRLFEERLALVLLGLDARGGVLLSCIQTMDVVDRVGHELRLGLEHRAVHERQLPSKVHSKDVERIERRIFESARKSASKQTSSCVDDHRRDGVGITGGSVGQQAFDVAIGSEQQRAHVMPLPRSDRQRHGEWDRLTRGASVTRYEQQRSSTVGESRLLGRELERIEFMRLRVVTCWYMGTITSSS